MPLARIVITSGTEQMSSLVSMRGVMLYMTDWIQIGLKLDNLEPHRKLMRINQRANQRCSIAEVGKNLLSSSLGNSVRVSVQVSP